MKHCIVTPELVHLFRNGGVGTNSYYLAQFLARHAGDEVTILYTREVDNLPQWKERFKKECGAKFVAINETEEVISAFSLESQEQIISLRVYRWLREQAFDAIHFQHYLAAGFCSIQAKRLGEAFEKTHLITIVNSPSQWMNEATERFPSGNVAEMALNYMERYCAEHCDTLLSPSLHLIQWMKKAGWTLAPDTRNIPSYLPQPDPVTVPPLDPTHLVFLGRLETRKGIQIFTEAAKAFAKWLKELPARRPIPEAEARLRLSYVGRNVYVDGVHSDVYLTDALQGLDQFISWEVRTDLGHHEAVEFAEKNAHALFVFPSAMDNFPYAMQEGMVRGLHQIAASTGGVGEFFTGDDCKFEPTAKALFEKLCGIFENGLPRAKPAFTPEQSAALRLDFVRELQTKAALLRETSVPNATCLSKDHPLISVCVPHYNMADYLPATLECLARQTYPSFEVIVVDDGSTCERALQVSAAMKSLYEPRGWKFLTKTNSGVCDARNLAVENSSGDLLAFVDADNLPFPEMLEGLESGMRRASLDCLTSYLYYFDDGESSRKDDLRLLWPFLGGCPEASLFMNSLGDTNMLIRKPAYQAVGGFRKSFDESSEDIALLLRVAFSGYRMDTSSAKLFAYRRRQGSMSRSANKYWRRMTVMEVFLERLEPWAQNLFMHKFGDQARSKDSVHTSAKVQEYREKHLIEREKRRERDRKADERYGTLLQMRSNPYVRLGRFLRIVKRNF